MSRNDFNGCSLSHDIPDTVAGAENRSKKGWAFNGIQTDDIRDGGAIIYQLSYQVIALSKTAKIGSIFCWKTLTYFP